METKTSVERILESLLNLIEQIPRTSIALKLDTAILAVRVAKGTYLEAFDKEMGEVLNKGIVQIINARIIQLKSISEDPLSSALAFADEKFDEDVLHTRQLLITKLIDLDLSVRALTCLKAANVMTLGDLVACNRNDLLKLKNFGKKSLTELDDFLNNIGLNFGMDLKIYGLIRGDFNNGEK